MTTQKPETGREVERGQPSSDYSGTGVPPADLAQVMARVARELDTERGVDATMDALMKAAVLAIPGGESVGITEVHKRGQKIEVTFASDDFVVKLDAAHYELAEGPCLDAAFEHRTVRVKDFSTEQRWPRFSARAHALGARSLLSLQLYVHGEDLAALNVYSRRAGAFNDESEQVGLVFASHAAIAMANARRVQQIRTAVDSRDIIGQAKGILMERFKITGEEAFTVLVKTSSETNTKLHDVATNLASTGELPHRTGQRRSHRRR